MIKCSENFIRSLSVGFGLFILGLSANSVTALAKGYNVMVAPAYINDIAIDGGCVDKELLIYNDSDEGNSCTVKLKDFDKSEDLVIEPSENDFNLNAGEEKKINLHITPKRDIHGEIRTSLVVSANYGVGSNATTPEIGIPVFATDGSENLKADARVNFSLSSEENSNYWNILKGLFFGDVKRNWNKLLYGTYVLQNDSDANIMENKGICTAKLDYKCPRKETLGNIITNGDIDYSTHYLKTNSDLDRDKAITGIKVDGLNFILKYEDGQYVLTSNDSKVIDYLMQSFQDLHSVLGEDIPTLGYILDNIKLPKLYDSFKEGLCLVANVTNVGEKSIDVSGNALLIKDSYKQAFRYTNGLLTVGSSKKLTAPINLERLGKVDDFNVISEVVYGRDNQVLIGKCNCKISTFNIRIYIWLTLVVMLIILILICYIVYKRFKRHFKDNDKEKDIKIKDNVVV